jgi:hypothetical protein
MNNIVYQVEINDLQHLKAHIWNAVVTVTPNKLQATWNEATYRWIFAVPPREPTLTFI